jgi:hypothetical protein
VREPVYQRSLARWKNYEPDLVELFAALTSRPAGVPSNAAILDPVRASTFSTTERLASFPEQTPSLAVE